MKSKTKEEIKAAIAALKWQTSPHGAQAGIEAVVTAIEALERQLPVFPNGDDNGGYPENFVSWAECSKCGLIFPDDCDLREEYNFCPNCGQRVDWTGLEV